MTGEICPLGDFLIKLLMVNTMSSSNSILEGSNMNSKSGFRQSSIGEEYYGIKLPNSQIILRTFQHLLIKILLRSPFS
jgi:hypothetical protein